MTCRVSQDPSKLKAFAAFRTRLSFPTEFKSCAELVAWYCGNIQPIRLKSGIVWATQVTHAEDDSRKWTTIPGAGWTVYRFEWDDPGQVMLEEMFVARFKKGLVEDDQV